jgi:hypothetical protein
MRRSGSYLVKSVVAVSAIALLGFPLYAQIAPEEDPASLKKERKAQDNADYDPDPYYIDGVEYKPYSPHSSRQKVQNQQTVNKPNPQIQTPSNVSSGVPQISPPRVAPPSVEADLPSPNVSTSPKSALSSESKSKDASSSSSSKSAEVVVALEKRTRYGSAIIQALDKVTAETVRFEVPVGKLRKYKSLIFSVKACETTAKEEAMSDTMAYIEVRTAPPPAANGTIQKSEDVFKGWTFASSPGLNPIQHPVYDAWVVSCRTPLPVAVADKS